MRNYIIIPLLIFLCGCAAPAIIKAGKTKHKAVISTREADKLLKQGNHNSALKLYEQFLKTAKSDHRIPVAHFNAGVILFSKKLYEKAIKHFNIIIDKYPHFAKEQEVINYMALSYFRLFDYHNAIAKYNDLFKKYPNSKDSKSMLNVANSYYGIGDFPNAKKAYLRIWNRPDIKTESSDITYKLGLCAFYMLDYKTAQHYLQRALLLERKPQEKAKAMFILGKVYVNKNDFLKSFDFFMRANKNIAEYKLNMPETKKEADRTITEILEHLNGEELESVYHNYVPDFPSDIALYKYIDYLYKKGEYKKALMETGNFIRLFPDNKRVSDILFIKTKIDQYEKPQITLKIGAIIPLSGRFSVYGEKILRGIQLAVEEINAKTKNKVAVITKDDEGKAMNTRKAFKELASLSDVLGIIGPVLSDGVLAVKDLADEYQIPLITPSAGRKGLPGMSRMIFRNCLTNKHQGEFIAEFAIDKLCLKTFAIMFPDNKYGKQLQEIFTKTVEELGGRVIYAASYSEGETDFKKQCRRINRFKPDSVFIADYADKAAMILPQLAFYSVGKTKHKYTILGTKGWYTRKLIAQGEKYVSNSFFPSAFFKESKDIQVVNFYQNFVAHFTDEPDDLAAQAFDTTNILFQAIKNSDKTRKSITEELFKIQDFPGVSGYSSIQEDGDSLKKLRMLTIQKKRFVEVEGNEAWLCSNETVN